MKRRIKRGLNYITTNTTITHVYGSDMATANILLPNVTDDDINTINAYRFIRNHIKAIRHAKG